MAESAPNQTPLAPRLHGVAPPPLSLSLSLFCPISLLLYHMQILVIFFKCCLLLPCIQFLPGALAAPLPAFSHFSIFHVRFVVVADDTTHIHTLTHTQYGIHTRTCYTLHLYSRLCVAYIFIIFFM